MRGVSVGQSEGKFLGPQGPHTADFRDSASPQTDFGLLNASVARKEIFPARSRK